ncbi:MAG: B12-binding domain-containing protein [Thermoanaerobaculia bacterium]
MWTSTDVARLFGVGVSSVKRWTDEGELEAVKTPGRHRRYSIPALYRFASLRNLPTDGLPSMDEARMRAVVPPPADVTLFQALQSGDAEAVRRLVMPRVSDLGQRAAFLDRVVGDALREIGIRWAAGELGIEQEHRATNLVSEAIDGLRPGSTPGAALVTLACPPDEWHELPLRLVRLMFEWRGWRTDYAGANLPWNSIRRAVDEMRPAVLALTARTADPFRYTDFDRLVAHCASVGTTVVVGGSWARGGNGRDSAYQRFRTLRGLARWLRQPGNDPLRLRPRRRYETAGSQQRLSPHP